MYTLVGYAAVLCGMGDAPELQPSYMVAGRRLLRPIVRALLAERITHRTHSAIFGSFAELLLSYLYSTRLLDQQMQRFLSCPAGQRLPQCPQ